LPEEYGKCLVGLTAILREAGATSNQTQDSKEKIRTLSLAKECYYMKLDLLTNATVVKDAMRFVSEHNNKKEEVKEKDISSVASVAPIFPDPIIPIFIFLVSSNYTFVTI
jgi:competence transcription factor ComK